LFRLRNSSERRAIPCGDGTTLLYRVAKHSRDTIVQSRRRILSGKLETCPKTSTMIAAASWPLQSLATLIKDPPPGAPVSPILPPMDGFLALDKTKLRASFAADVNAEKAA
jgi:hypothetical protein